MTTTQTANAQPHKFFADPRVEAVVEYLAGFVPNRYKYPAPGNGVRHVRTAEGFRSEVLTYDRKRSGGVGPAAIGFSVRGGRLISE